MTDNTRTPLPWVVFDPDMGHDFYATEAEAIAAAEAAIDGYLDDGTWNEDVEGIFIARITHGAVQANVITPDDPTWNTRTGGSDCASWFDIVIEPTDAITYKQARA